MARLLSYSQVNTFVTCPYKWLLQRNGWRAREKSEALVLGTIIHQCIAEFLRTGVLKVVKPADFDDLPDEGQRNHVSAQAARMLMEFWNHVVDGRPFNPVAVERHLRRGDFHGYVDCVADVDDYRIVIDWKTTKWPYDDWRVHVDDQLTAYAWLVEPHYQIDEVAFVTLQKPLGKVEWHRSMRDQKQMDDFAQKIGWVRRQMDGGIRHRNPGNCGWCSFVGHCAFGEDLGVRNERGDF